MNLFKKLLSLFLLLSILLIPSDVSARGGGCQVNITSAQALSSNTIRVSMNWSTNASWNNTRLKIKVRDISNGRIVKDTGYSLRPMPVYRTSGSYTLHVSGMNLQRGKTYNVYAYSRCGSTYSGFSLVTVRR